MSRHNRPYYRLDNEPSQSSNFEAVSFSTNPIFLSTTNPEPGVPARQSNKDSKDREIGEIPRSPERNDIDSGSFNPSINQVNVILEADRCASYLRLVGINQEWLNKRPSELLTKFKKTSCEICDKKWEKSRANARMHYNSKQHTKNEKKWLLKREAVRNIVNKKEMRIGSVRPRCIGCELCDVDFTSKIIMDAHYNGKQHLSIVNGSKLPKRKTLLENQELLRLLIEREKPFCDGAPKPQDARAKITKAKEDLHCKICDVSVQTEEVMVIHKNGKKHLKKERQIILRLCKLRDGFSATLTALDLKYYNYETTTPIIKRTTPQ